VSASHMPTVGIDHGRGNIVVPEQVLNGADAGAAWKQVGSEGTTKGMGADVLRQTGTANRHLNGLVDDAGVDIMATGEARTRVNGEIPGRKDILTAPLLDGMGVFPSQSMREVCLAMPLSQVRLMQRLDPGQVVLEQRRQGRGKVVNRSLSPLPERTVSGFI
jgi:hypothetical protein